MVLTDLREQMDCYGLDCALGYLNKKSSEIRNLQNNNTFSQFHRRLTSLVERNASNPKMECLAQILVTHFTLLAQVWWWWWWWLGGGDYVGVVVYVGGSVVFVCSGDAVFFVCV